MQLTRHQIKILKYIRKPKTYLSVTQKFKINSYRNFVSTMYQDELLFDYEFEPITDDTLIQAINTAIALLEDYERRYKHFFIPVVISIIALIKSFMPELALLWKQLMQLLK